MPRRPRIKLAGMPQHHFAMERQPTSAANWTKRLMQARHGRLEGRASVKHEREDQMDFGF